MEDLLHGYVGAYTRSPQWLKTWIGGVYSRLPVRLRYGAGYAAFDAETRLRDPEVIAQLADEKLKATLTWAAQTVPAYAHLKALVREPGSARRWLVEFPLLEKSTLKADEASQLSRAVPRARRLLTHTGGSTSIPMRLHLEKHVSRSKDFAYNRAFDRIAGIGSDDLVLALRGRTVPGAERHDGPVWMFDPIKRYVHLSSDHLEAEHMPRYMQALRHWKPRFVHAYPSALYPIARWLDAHPDPSITAPVRSVQLFSENVYDYQVALIRKVFDCPVLLEYGHSERAVKAVSLPDDPRYHFWPLYGHVELIALDANRPCAPGELGEIVATGFDNRVLPLIRYRTGDLAVRSLQAPSLPGVDFVAERIEGRVQEFLVCNDRRLVSITTIGAAHFHELAASERMQFVQERPGHAILKVQTRAPLSAAARASLEHGIREKTQGGLSVDVVETDTIARTVSGKERLLVQQLDISNFLGASLHEAA